MKIKINRITEGAEIKLPARAHYNDAGADVYTTFGETLKPHETRRIPLGFSLELPDGVMACVFPRSGMSLEASSASCRRSTPAIPVRCMRSSPT